MTKGVGSTDAELERMQKLAAAFSSVRLNRPAQPQCLPPGNDAHNKNNSSADGDSMLLLGLMLILAADGADKMLLLMLFYIFQGGAF